MTASSSIASSNSPRGLPNGARRRLQEMECLITILFIRCKNTKKKRMRKDYPEKNENNKYRLVLSNSTFGSSVKTA